MRTARIIFVAEPAGECPRVTLLIGDVETEIHWPHAVPPAVGEIYCLGPGDPPRPGARIGAALPGAWQRDSDALRWRRRDARGQTRMDALWQRHRIRRAVRDYLDAEGFIEIDTPALVRGTTPDAAVASFAVASFAGGDRYLITSSEYQIKRLEVGGFERVYTLAANYRRDDGEGAFRSPQFTMLEWARVGESLAAIEADAERFIWRAHQALGGSGTIAMGGHTIDLTPPFATLSIAEAVERHVGIAMPDFSLDRIAAAVAAAGIPLREAWREDIHFLFTLLSDHLQHTLGFERPVFLHDWPAFETASTVAKDATGTAERSELYIGGIEIADGFPTLTDWTRQTESFAAQLRRRANEGASPVALDEAYLDAMRVGLPQGAGMALGFDRLVMVLTGRSDIRSVMAFGWDEA